MDKTTRYLMAALGAKTIIKQENNMNNYFVHYSYNTTYPHFSSQYAHIIVQADSKEQAIKKARKQAPKNATHFRAYLR